MKRLDFSLLSYCGLLYCYVQITARAAQPLRTAQQAVNLQDFTEADWVGHALIVLGQICHQPLRTLYSSYIRGAYSYAIDPGVNSCANVMAAQLVSGVVPPAYRGGGSVPSFAPLPQSIGLQCQTSPSHAKRVCRQPHRLHAANMTSDELETEVDQAFRDAINEVEGSVAESSARRSISLD